jgi:hypothetical protein
MANNRNETMIGIKITEKMKGAMTYFETVIERCTTLEATEMMKDDTT